MREIDSYHNRKKSGLTKSEKLMVENNRRLDAIRSVHQRLNLSLEEARTKVIDYCDAVRRTRS